MELTFKLLNYNRINAVRGFCCSVAKKKKNQLSLSATASRVGLVRVVMRHTSSRDVVE